MSASSVANARVFRHLMKTTRTVGLGCDLGNQEGFERYVSQRFRTVAEANRRARIRPHELKKHRAMVVHYSNAMKEALDDEALTSILNALAAGVGSSVYKRSLEKGFFDLVVFNKRSVDRGEADEEQTADRQNRIMQAAIAPVAEKLTNLHRGLSVPELRNAMSSAKVGTSVVVLSHGSSEVVIEIDEELNKQAIFVRVEDDEFMRVMLTQGQLQAQWLRENAGVDIDEISNNNTLEKGKKDEKEGFLSIEEAMMLDEDPHDFTAKPRGDTRDTTNKHNSSSPSSGGPSTANLNASSTGGGEGLEGKLELHAHHFDLFNNRVEVAESDLIRGTTLHAHWSGVATRLLDAMLEEMPLHRSRSTVLCGHGVGGAVALVLGLQLHTMGFEVKNVLQFGSPRVVQDTLNRYVTAVNPIRVVINGDPCTQGPATTSEGESFVHVGEVLMLDLPESDQNQEEKGDQRRKGATRKKEGNSSIFFGEDEDDDDDDDDQQLSHSRAGNRSSASTATGRSRGAGDEEDEDDAALFESFAKRYDIHRYAELLKRDDVVLTYAEGDDSFLEPEWKFLNRKGERPASGGTEYQTRHGGAAPTYDR